MFCTAKETTREMKRQPKEQEKIFVNNISNTGLIFKTYRELVQLNKKKKQLKIGKNLSRVYERPKCTWKDTRRHQSLGKFKSKSQEAIISHLLQQPSSKSQGLNAGMNVEKREDL